MERRKDGGVLSRTKGKVTTLNYIYIIEILKVWTIKSIFSIITLICYFNIIIASV